MSAAPSQRARGYALVASAAALWATWPFVLRASASFGPVATPLATVIVMLVVGLAALPGAVRAARARAHTGGVRPRERWLSFVVLGIAAASNTALLFAAYARTSIAIAVLTHYLTPVLVALAGPLAGETSSPRSRAAALVSFTGLVLLLAPWSAEQRGATFVGAALGAGSAVFYALAVFVQKRLSASFSADELLAYHAPSALGLLLCLVPKGAWADASPAAVAILVLGGVGPGWLANALFIRGLHRVPASHASTLTLLEPLLAVVAAAFVYKETLGALAAVGSAAILAGAAAVIVEPKP